MLYYFIQQIADTQTGSCGNRHRIPDTQVIKFIGIRHKFLEAVYLVDGQDNRLSGTAQHICHLGIRVHQSLSLIHI